jgi:hypothetical protein
LKKWIGPIIFEDSHRPGSYVPTPSIKPSPPLPPPPPPPRTWLQWTGDGFTSLFGSLIPSTGKDGQTVGGEAITPSSMFRRPRRPSPNEFWTGEATAELIKVSYLSEDALIFLETDPGDKSTGRNDGKLRLLETLCRYS